jgi:hypothetical protein
VSLGELDRPDILERVSDLDAEFRALVTKLDGATVTAAVGEANGFFVVAVAAWGDGLAEMDDAITEILDGEDDGRLGETMLDRAYSNLRVGDRAYAGFRAAVATLDEELRAPAFPEFGYFDPDRAAFYNAALMTDRLRATLRFEENRDVSVRATTEPEPLGANGGIPVVPDSETFLVIVVVTNEGNVSAELVTVTMRLSEVGGDGLEERSEIVPAMEPGEATTVTFDELVLEPGSGYELSVAAEFTDDDVPDNNMWELDFIRNQP